MNRIHERALRRVYDDYTSTFNEIYGKINRIHERALRIVYDDYTSTFNELMVR